MEKERLDVIEHDENCRVMFCGCQHEYQDERYGKHKRLHNRATRNPDNMGGWRCTVCGDVKRG